LSSSNDDWDVNLLGPPPDDLGPPPDDNGGNDADNDDDDDDDNENKDDDGDDGSDDGDDDDDDNDRDIPVVNQKEVVCAIIMHNEGNQIFFLLGRSAGTSVLDGHYEFPGGKVSRIKSSTSHFDYILLTYAKRTSNLITLFSIN